MQLARKDVLNGWKEIAAYLGRDPRTVERWEKQRGLPVRRLPGSGRATVYALMHELDAWLASRPIRDSDADEDAPGTARVPTEPRAMGPGSVEAASTAVKPEASSAPEAVIVQKRTHTWWRYGQWALAATLLVVIGWTWVVSTGWARGGGWGTDSRAEESESAEARRLVPDSAVPGVEELYLRGAFQSERRTPESLRRAHDAFSEAIRRDPRYAPAYAGLASTYVLMREYSVLPDAEAYPRAEEAARMAMKLTPELPQAHAVLGFVDFFWEWDSVAAAREFGTALREDPKLALTHHWYGSMLLHQGRFKEGLQELNTAQRLDPSSSAILTMRAYALALSGHKPEGLEILDEAMLAEAKGQYRNPATMHLVMAQLCLMPPRDLERFLAESLLAAQLKEDETTVTAMHHAGEVYRKHGEAAMWRALLDDEQQEHKTGGPTYAMARYESQLGARDQALHDLSALYSRHEPALIGVSVDPMFADLRQDPRFEQLRAQMGLPGSDRR